jgi:tetratricopeptide (TPR) repeat protein
LIARRIEEVELKEGRAALIVVDCPHCTVVLALDRDTGRCELYNEGSLRRPDMGFVIYDMTVKEQSQDVADRLVKEGHNLMGTDIHLAEAAFREALTLSKHHPMARYNLGVCRYQLQDLDGAEAEYRHALEFDPKLVRAWNNLGTVLSMLGRTDEAAEAFDRGLTVDPDYPKCFLGKANLEAMRGDFAAVRRLLNTALEKDRNYALAREFLDRLAVMERNAGQPPGS